MQDYTIEGLFAGEDIWYRVPIYQRHYVWNEIHWYHLWNDIKEKADLVYEAILKPESERLLSTETDRPKPHFTGVIVTNANEDGEIVIVDGQQRLTTFQIVLCAIRDICAVKFPNTSEETKDKKDIFSYVNDLITNPSRSTDESTPDKLYKLLPTDGPDREAYRDLIAGNNLGDGLLPDAYKWFKDKIEGYIEDEVEGKVVNNYNKILAVVQTLAYYFKIVLIELNKVGWEAAKVFESLNGRGLPLTQFDLLRNNVFLRAGNEKNTFYVNCWRDFNNDPLWLSEKVVDDFLQNFLAAKLNTNIKSEGPLFDLYQRSYLVNLRKALGVGIGHEDDPTLVELEFEELQQYSKTYAEIANSDPESPMWFYQFMGKRLELKSWHPLILLLKTESGLSEESEKKIFRILESYIVRYLLCYPEIQTRDLDRHFQQLRRAIVTQIRKKNNSSQKADTILEILKRDRNKWPDNPKVKEALSTAGNHWSRTLIQYILLKIECENTDPEFTNLQLRRLSEEPPDRNLALSIEHVMPQAWEKAGGQ